MYFDLKDEYTIPDFIFRTFTKSGTEADKSRNGMYFAESEDLACSLSFSNVHPEPVIKQDDKRFSVLIGSPVLEDKLDYSRIFDAVDENGLCNENLVKELNGEFLLINFCRKNGHITIINDRFTSVPLYYHFCENKKTLTVSPYFTSIKKALEGENLKLDQTGLAQFIHFQRLLGERTYLEGVKFLSDASILEIKDEHLNKRRYWERDYTKNNASLMDNARLMAKLVRQSVRRKTSDGKRYGHFLSGGMDSRSVLGAFEENIPTCFTATLSENREFNTAREIARSKGAEHIFLKLHPEHYSHIYEAATKIVGGMYNYDHGLFLGYNSAVTQYADVCFHGHGFDYMFQGMYIPARRMRLFGRNLYLRKMIPLPDDLVSYYIDNVSYRIKNADISAFTAEDKKEQLSEMLRNSIGEVYEKAKELSSSKNDQWEYLTFHHLSRHYSFPNHASVASFVEQRTVSFDNDIFDFYLSLPVEQRFDGKIEKRCLEVLDPALAQIWSANTDLPVTASCLKQTVYQLAGSVKRRILPQQKGNSKSEWEERTWPSREYVLRNQSKLKQAVKDVLDSGVLEQVDFLDKNKLKEEVPKWLDGENIYGLSGDFVQTLLTLGTFLS